MAVAGWLPQHLPHTKQPHVMQCSARMSVFELHTVRQKQAAANTVRTSWRGEGAPPRCWTNAKPVTFVPITRQLRYIHIRSICVMYNYNVSDNHNVVGHAYCTSSLRLYGPLDLRSALSSCRDRISITIAKSGNLWHFLYRPAPWIELFQICLTRLRKHCRRHTATFSALGCFDGRPDEHNAR